MLASVVAVGYQWPAIRGGGEGVWRARSGAQISRAKKNEVGQPHRPRQASTVPAVSHSFIYMSARSRQVHDEENRFSIPMAHCKEL